MKYARGDAGQTNRYRQTDSKVLFKDMVSQYVMNTNTVELLGSLTSIITACFYYDCLPGNGNKGRRLLENVEDVFQQLIGER